MPSRDAALTLPARVLYALPRRGPRSWADLRRAGLSRDAVLLAVGEIAAVGHDRVRVGRELVELEPVEG